MQATTNWSEFQDRAFAAAMAGKSFVLNAGPGSGKTTSIVEMVKRLSAAGKKSMAVVAFGSGIQAELKARLGYLAPQGVKVTGTYGLGFGPLARRIKELGHEVDVQDVKYYTISKELITEAMSVWLGSGIELDRKTGEYVAILKKLVDYSRMTMTNPRDFAAVEAMAIEYNLETEVYILPLIDRALNIGSQMAEQTGVVDFADMLYLSLTWGLKFWQYKIIVGDEIQDLSNLQRAGIAASLMRGGQFIGVGDKRQSIYGFAGADMRSYDNTKAAFRADELELPICYRSDSAIIAEVNLLFPDHPIYARPGAPLGKVETICEDGKIDATNDIIAAHRAGEGVVVLCRTTAALVWRCIQLIRRRIPAQVKGRDIGSDLLEYIDGIAALDGFNYAANFREYAKSLQAMKTRKYQTWQGEDMGWVTVDGKERQVARIEDYFAAILLCYEEFLSPTIEVLKGEIGALFADNVRGIILMTGHRAKGLEFQTVFIDSADKMQIRWPGMTDDQKYQERCVQYVMTSRAKNRLVYIKDGAVR
jgi:superfamily I DNA/RNA helicase